MVMKMRMHKCRHFQSIYRGGNPKTGNELKPIQLE
jgi:hypothetical protein